MGTTIGHTGVAMAEPLGLEAEVSLWQSRRSFKAQSTIGNVEVVRIPKRVRPTSRPTQPKRHAFSIAER